MPKGNIYIFLVAVGGENKLGKKNVPTHQDQSFAVCINKNTSALVIKLPNTCLVPLHQRQLSSKHSYQQIYFYHFSTMKRLRNEILCTNGFVRKGSIPKKFCISQVLGIPDLNFILRHHDIMEYLVYLIQFSQASILSLRSLAVALSIQSKR